MNVIAAILAVDHLSYTYRGASRPALADVSLAIEEGELVVLCGPSGCGKSTLALALGGYLHQQPGGTLEGSMSVAGRDISAQTLYEVADTVGLVQQNPENQFCTLTVADEVAFGLENRRLDPSQIEDRLTWALCVAGADGLRDRSLATLSGGEKQKVAIASMIAAQPRVLIFDEPTSNLDPTATRAIFQVLAEIRCNTAITVIVVEHKLGYLRQFQPRVVRMEDGRITESHGTILDEPICARPVPHAEGSALIEIQGLAHNYGSGPVLNGLNLTLHAGQLVALMGDNGSGKTTLLHCMMGLIRPSSGDVRLLGTSLLARRVSESARKVGFVFQNPDHQLLGTTVWRDATLTGANLSLYDEVVPRAEALLRQTDLLARREDNPFRLSYGERRRLNVVASTSHSPLIVLADEILIGQDPNNAARLMNLLRATADSGGCVVLALHDPPTALRYADRVLFLERGDLAFDLPPASAIGPLAERGYLPIEVV